MQMLWQNVLCNYMVCRAKTGESVGLATAYNADLRNGHAYLALVLVPEAVGSLIGHDANLLMVNYLLRGWNFRKLYGETSARNVEAFFRSAVGKELHIEGRLKDHEYYDGRYWDTLIVALYREEWERIIARRLHRIT